MAEKEENKQVNLFESSLETDFSKPKTLDTSGLEEQIQKIQTPIGRNVYDKLAALYRQETQGRSLRETTDLQRALLPAAELYRQREEEANERFAELVEQIPTFDDSTLYGEKTGGVGFESEITGVSNEIRNDLRLLSRLNPADPRYNELARKVRQKQNNIIKYNDLNQKLLDIRNSEIEPSEISNTYSAAEKEAYRQIRLGSTENIAFKNGKLIFTYTDGNTTTEVDIDKLDINPFEGSYDTRSDDLEIQKGAVDMARNNINIKDSFGFTDEYSTLMGKFESFKGNTSNKNILGLILDGNTKNSSYRNINTVEFVNSLDDAGISIQELQTSKDLSKVVEINGVKQSIRKHFFDFYLNNLNNTISTSKKQDQLRKVDQKDIKNILRRTIEGFDNQYYNSVNRYFDFDVNDNNELVFIPKDNFKVSNDLSINLGLKGNNLNQGEAYNMPTSKDIFDALYNNVISSNVLQGKDPIQYKNNQSFVLDPLGPMPGRQRINSEIFLSIVEEALGKKLTTEDIVSYANIFGGELPGGLRGFDDFTKINEKLKENNINVGVNANIQKYFKQLLENIIV